jgi:phosphoribosylformylglycinamidine cyclo-ligase
MSNETPKSKLTYAEAGVDIRAGEDAVERIKALARQTFGPNVLSEIGSFGGFYKLPAIGLKSPVLVSSAFMTSKHDTVGEDLVNHCVNDILVHGARGLFFLDYIATGKVDPTVIAEIVSGLARGCKNAGMALIGGETAEMPDFYTTGEYDIAGFIVGLVDQEKIINGRTVQEGDVCIGLASNGLHTNGYSLARKVVFDVGGHKPTDHIPELGGTIANALMQVHRCYAPLIFPLLDKFNIHGMAHITGGGLPGNLNRVLPKNLDAAISLGSWPILPIFEYLRKVGDLDSRDIYSAFNMGIGYVLVVAPSDADGIIGALGAAGETGYRIGRIIPGKGNVQLS